MVHEITIAARPEDVFPYFTDPRRMIAWKAVSAELDGRPGGRLRRDGTGRSDVALGTYLEVDPPRRVVFTFGWEGNDVVPPGSSTVEVTLSAEGEGTRVRLVHRGLPAARRSHSAAGWSHYLARPALAPAGRDPGPDPPARPHPGAPLPPACGA